MKATNKYQDAILYLKQAIKLDPNKVETHTSLADLFHKIGKLDDALYTYENAINYSQSANVDDGSCEFNNVDINGDGIINVIDIVQLVNIVLD